MRWLDRTFGPMLLLAFAVWVYMLGCTVIVTMSLL
jgi:hypothetical protein